MEQALHLCQRLASLLVALGLQRNPTKDFWELCQFSRHMGVDIYSASGMFYAPADKRDRLSRQATRLIGRATWNARWLPVREMQSLAGQAPYLFLAIPPARFFLRELHSVVDNRCMKPCFRFCEAERRPALAADPGTMARYVTWLGSLRTIKASNLPPYLSAVNNFFKDHGREPMAMGDLVSRVRKGRAASQVRLHPELMRAPMPARVVLKALTMAKALRLELGLTWGTDLATVGATTAAYVIGVTLQKIKYFGGWAKESSVVLDYIDPTVLPCPAAWHLFGWMTPWGGQPARLPRHVAI
eukprot:jgi/Tetstr1/432137/TSEL_021594.t1